jgi:hypothetical protein
MFVACDESGVQPSDKYLVIGSAWIPKEQLPDFEAQTTASRLTNKCWGEIEWQKIKKSMPDGLCKVYKDLIDLGIKKMDASFHIIVIEKKLLDMVNCHSDYEIVRFKFIYFLISRNAQKFLSEKNRKLHIVFDDFQESKENREENRVLAMKQFTERYLMTKLEHLQPCCSHICSLIQLCDLITGAVATKWNKAISEINPKKIDFITYIENLINKDLAARTLYTEKKFNIWIWRPSTPLKKVIELTI